MDVRDFPRPDDGAIPMLKLTPHLAAKVVASLSLSTLGIYYLAAGKREASLQKMILGALLMLASVFLF